MLIYLCAMLKKGSKLYSVINRKCPHCHEGDFFVTRNPYDLSHTGDLLEACSVCRRKFEPEPGFYYGGMYVSYALSVALGVSVYVAMVVLFPNSSPTTRLLALLGAFLVTAPVMYAWSKVLWANLFTGYKGVAIQPGEDVKWLPR